MKGESEGLVDIVDVVDDVLYVSIGGVFAFNDLYFVFVPDMLGLLQVSLVC